MPAKLFVADVGVEIGLLCQRVLGAYGLSEEFDMAQTVMDLIGMPIVEGSSHMQKNNIANRLGLADLRLVRLTCGRNCL